jgi:hypothetical protein
LYTVPDVNIPQYWIRPQQRLSAKAGAHRFLWDLHYQPLNVPAAYPISAIYHNTAPVATSPWVMPGQYTVKLTVNGQIYTQPLTVRMDPRVKTPEAGLALQHSLSLEAYKGRQRAMASIERIRRFRARIAAALSSAGGGRKDSLQQLDAGAAALEGAGRRGMGMRGPVQPENGPKSFSQLQNDYAGIFGILEEADMEPTEQVAAALKETGQAALVTAKALVALQRQALILKIPL